jgi:hypothetical protein
VPAGEPTGFTVVSIPTLTVSELLAAPVEENGSMALSPQGSALFWTNSSTGTLFGVRVNSKQAIEPVTLGPGFGDLTVIQ